ncbi:unnamed protein product [Musa banksii]
MSNPWKGGYLGMMIQIVLGIAVLVVLLPPRVDEEKDPGEAEDEVADELARPVAGEVLEAALEEDAPQGHGGMEEDAALGEEGLEVAVLDEGHHEEEEADGEEQQAGEGVRGLDQQLVVGRRPLQPPRRLPPVPHHRDLVQVEHHQRPARGRHRRVQQADRRKDPRRRRRRRRRHSFFPSSFTYSEANQIDSPSCNY